MDHLSLKHEYLQAYVTTGNLLLHYLWCNKRNALEICPERTEVMKWSQHPNSWNPIKTFAGRTVCDMAVGFSSLVLLIVSSCGWILVGGQTCSLSGIYWVSYILKRGINFGRAQHGRGSYFIIQDTFSKHIIALAHLSVAINLGATIHNRASSYYLWCNMALLMCP